MKFKVGDTVKYVGDTSYSFKDKVGVCVSGYGDKLSFDFGSDGDTYVWNFWEWELDELRLVSSSTQGPRQTVVERPLDTQVGGDHYKNLGIQPWDYTFANNLGPAEHTVLRYITRWNDKNGLEDLKKARHTLDIYIEQLEKESNE